MAKYELGINDLETLCIRDNKQALLCEWNYEKNNGMEPKMYSANSKIKVWWKCANNHEWISGIGSRYASNSKCPYCVNKMVWPGYNDLLTTNPEVVKEWNYEKNIDISPNQFTANSGKKVWWKCLECNHEWETVISVRTGGHGCPECSRLKRTSTRRKNNAEKNNFANNYKQLALEWDYEKNEIDINSVSGGSYDLVWWKCKENHSYCARIVSRTKQGTGCPFCANTKILTGYNDLKTKNPHVATYWNYLKNEDLRPEKIASCSAKEVWWICTKGHEWKQKIVYVTQSETKEKCPYCRENTLKLIAGVNDLYSKRPDLLEEWDYEKNVTLSPKEVTTKSSKKVWWKCKNCANEWMASIGSRCNGRGCPKCSLEKQAESLKMSLLKKRKSLAVKFPDLINEWDQEKNGNITPYDRLPGSEDKVWWKCEFGHEYETKICNRTNGSGCPICNRISTTSFPEQAIYYYVKKIFTDAINGERRLLKKELDIFIPSKKIGIEYDGYKWHQDERDTKNDILKNKLCLEQGIKLYRIREEGCAKIDLSGVEVINCISNNEESLEEAICKLIKLLGYECDVNLKRDKNYIREMYFTNKKNQSLSNKFPNIAKEWNYEKNMPIIPETVHFGSNVKYWWKCEKGHEWEAKVSVRTKGYRSCPVCELDNEKFLKIWCEKNDKLDILGEWDNNKNAGISYENISRGSNKIVWWRCPQNHSYKKSIIERTKGRGCPYCSGKKVLKGFNDLQTLNKELASQWVVDKNKIQPDEVTVKSNKKVYWKCEYGHEWLATVAHRTDGRGCPYCSHAKIMVGYNDLKTLHPDIADMWNGEKNKGVLIEEIMPSTNIKVWWKCEKGHEWQQKVVNITHSKAKVKCPFCNGRHK